MDPILARSVARRGYFPGAYRNVGAWVSLAMLVPMSYFNDFISRS